MHLVGAVISYYYIAMNKNAFFPPSLSFSIYLSFFLTFSFLHEFYFFSFFFSGLSSTAPFSLHLYLTLFILFHLFLLVLFSFFLSISFALTHFYIFLSFFLFSCPLTFTLLFFVTFFLRFLFRPASFPPITFLWCVSSSSCFFPLLIYSYLLHDLAPSFL